MLLGVIAVAVLAQPANAGSVTLAGSDPVDVSTAPLDITSAKLVYDASAGKVTLTVQTAAPAQDFRPALFYALLGQTSQAGQCVPKENTAAVLISMIWGLEGDGLRWVLINPADPENPVVQEVETQRTGATTTGIASASALKNFDFDCAQIQTKTQVANTAEGVPDDIDVDVMNVFPTSGDVVPPPVFTDQPDKDKDGIPDTKDKCPAEPGAKADGCVTISAKLAIRLGAKRVAIDKLVARTSGTVCPLKATVTVTTKKGKKNVSIGKGVVSVSTHGSFCRAYGVVKLKKSAKVAKITVKAKGMGSIAATRKR